MGLKRRATSFLGGIVAMAFCWAPFASSAQTVSIELNKFEPREKACRVYFVLENGTAAAFTSLKLDLVLFDSQGIVARRLAVQTAPLAAAKTSLKVFDVGGHECKSIGRILLNTVTECSGPDGAREGCTALISTSSRAHVPFTK